MRIKFLPESIFIETAGEDDGKVSAARRSDRDQKTFFFLVWTTLERAKSWLTYNGKSPGQFIEIRRDDFMRAMMDGVSREDLVVCNLGIHDLCVESSSFNTADLPQDYVIRLGDLEEKWFVVESTLRRTTLPESYYPPLLENLQENPSLTPKQLIEIASKAIEVATQALSKCSPGTCRKCGESLWAPVEISPTGKSVKWNCKYCSFQIIVKSQPSAVDEGTTRAAIPKEVQRDVWRRDSGRCVECGSRENIEFDHVIPVSRGGANTARNIQLLCQECNRFKSDKEPGEY